MESVGEAKTHLPRLLDAVAAGEVIRSLREARRGVTLGGLSLAALIDEGRR